MVTPDLNRTKRGKVRGDELAIQQSETAHPHPRDQMRERHF
jgi:hypothetical protein